MIFSLRNRYVLLLTIGMALVYSCNTDSRSNICIHEDTLKVYYPNGTLQSYDIICNGLKNGVSCFYLEDGTPEKCLAYKNDSLNGKSVHFFPNGKIRMEVYFKRGKLDGSYKIYDENGIVIRELMYENGKAIQ